ncbi:beta-N-acetylhexosaminidase [Deinococcus wulumuqiensis]
MSLMSGSPLPAPSDPVQPGQLLMVDIPGPDLDAETAAYLREHGIGAVCLFGKNVASAEQLRRLCADLRGVMGEHALIAIDHEGGAITRPEFWPFAPSAMGLGAANDPQLTEEVNAALARQLRSVGINWNFTPVLDVNVNPANPVIGDRAYGSDAARVTRHGQAALAGHTREGVAPCAKHFPGHGDTHQDSHLALPRVSKSRAELDAGELAPFLALLPDTPAIMTAHIVYDALDAESPATLSPRVLTGLLREEWGYGGVIVTDSMGMQAIDANYGRGEAAVQALRAGADLVMALGRREVQEQTLAAVAEYLHAPAHRADVAAKLGRLQALARRFPAQADTALDPQTDAALLSEAWARGLTAWPDAQGRPPQPPAPGSKVLLVAWRQPQREMVSEAAADAQTLARELGQVYDVELLAFDDAAQLDWAALRGRGLPVILASTFRHRQAALVGARPDLHLALYNPYAVLDVDAPAVLSYGFRPQARAAVLGWLRGERELAGEAAFLAPTVADC